MAIKLISNPSTNEPGTQIAYAENTALDMTLSGTLTDVPSLQIMVPAGTPSFWLEHYVPAASITATASNGAGFALMYIINASGGGSVASSVYRAQIPVSGQLAQSYIIIKRQMPGIDVDTTYKVQGSATVSNATVRLQSATGELGSLSPAYLRAEIR